MSLIAKPRIIYATACHASLCTTALDWVSVVTAATQRLQTRHGEGRWGLASHLQRQKCCAGCH